MSACINNTLPDTGLTVAQLAVTLKESFGEPALIAKFPYPGSVIAIEPSKVWKLAGDISLIC